MQPLPSFGLSHIAIEVADLDRSAALYQALLAEFGPGQTYVKACDPAGYVIELFHEAETRARDA